MFLLLLALAGAVWYWLDGLKARELGVEAARRTCEADGVQFLDDTAVLKRLGLQRDEDGRLRLQRHFAFEYSDTGNNRRGGRVILLGHRVVDVYAGPRIVTPAQSPTLH